MSGAAAPTQDMKLALTHGVVPLLFPIGLFALAAGALDRDEPTRFDKRFVQHSELELAELSMSIDGPDGPQEMEGEAPKMKIVDDETIEFTDERVKVEDGRIRELRRSFTGIDNTQSFEMTGEDGSETNETKNQSDLLGKTVRFSWDSEEEHFVVAWHECEGKDVILESLVEDADFRAWGPTSKEVAVGDTWKIAAAEYCNLQEPSGPMGYVEEGSDEDPEPTDASKQLRENTTGEIDATCTELREEGGRKLCVIKLEGEVQSKSLIEVDASEEEPAGEDGMETGVKLEGELVFDLGLRQFVQLEIDSEQSLTFIEKRTAEFDGQEISITQKRRFEGTKTYRFTCAPASK